MLSAALEFRLFLISTIIHNTSSASYFTGSQLSNTASGPVIAADFDLFDFATRTFLLPEFLPFPSHVASISTIQSSFCLPAIAPSKRASPYNIASSSQQYPSLSKFDDSLMGLPAGNDFGFGSGHVGYGPQTFIPNPSLPLLPSDPAPSIPVLAHPEYTVFLPSAYPLPPISTPQSISAPSPSTTSCTLAPSPSPIPTPRTTKASSKRSPKASKARTKAAPHRSRSSPSDIPIVDRLYYLLATRRKVVKKSTTSTTDHIHSSEDNEDEDAPSSGYKKCPGQPGTLSFLDTAALKARRPILWRRSRRDLGGSRGCRKCFSRTEKLARHLAKYKSIQGGNVTFMCPHTNCNKDYLRETNLMHHMTAHLIAGDPALPFPYPWNSPYLGMGDNVANVHWKAGFTAWTEDEDVVSPLP
ncbi:hypothetical protein M422DRAFT_248108 [Sphaerobolus stellatus SS14]|uniref:C2H2-type domain-containing protein n=1 Tax=Sphaerobolus stellatus (strain SS14) TaxID=990650 RepID=A0A0C9W5Y3_SPHS4|nr:hypothetical protein M422DRAFT_248108 [Sphaerobolus stellatus SS14]